MSLPPNTAAVLRHGEWDLPGDTSTECEGAVFHSPRPLFTEPTSLVPSSWMLDGGPEATLCGTCRDNLSVLLQMLYASDGSLDWAVRREFGNGIRALAIRGWKYFADHRPVTQ